MKARGIFAILAAQIAGLIGRVRLAPSRAKWHKPEQHVHARTRKPRGGTGTAGSKLWHRLSAGHSASAGFSDRQTRRWCKTGYWSEPRAEHRKRKAGAPA